MKLVFTFFLISVIVINAMGQGVKISTNPGSPNSASMLEIESTDKGLLPPRMTSNQRDLINNPPAGLRIYNIETNCENFYNGTSWMELCGTCTPQPQTANAGADQLNLTGTTATLAANTPANGTGAWSIVSGSGGSFSSAANAGAIFTGTAGASYTLRWTITTPCGTTQDDVLISFIAPFTCGSSTVTDASGNVYNTVQVGGQCWLKSNLRTNLYSDGSAIPASYMDQWGVNGAPSCNASNYNPTSCGVLYDGNVMQNSVSACPSGWHIPTLAEFQTLYSAVSSDSRRLFHPAAGCTSNCSGYDLYICGQHYSNWEGCGSGDQIYLWTRPNSGSVFTNSYITQYTSTNGAVSYNAVQASWINYNYSIRCIKD